MKKKLPLLLATSLLALPLTGVHAQERTAGGSLQNQASWNALASLLEKTNGDVKTLGIQVNQQKTCNKKGAFWIPENKTADADGCVAPIIVDKEFITQTGKSCSGLGCKVTINMAPYADMADVSVQATCMYGWCEKPYYTGSLPIATLKASWNNERVAGNPPSTKNSSVQASYNAATKILTLVTAYNGKSTDVNIGQTAMANVNIIVKSKVLQLPE